MPPIKAPERPKGLRFSQNRGLVHQFDVRAAEDTTELTVYDEIGVFGISAAQVREQLDQVTTSNLRLRINSPGGDVFDGIAIHNDLVQHPANVQVSVTGLAASAASLIAMAGDEVEIAENAFLMIHNAWALAIGDKNDMRQLADTLDQVDGALARTYARRAGDSVENMTALMDAETWLDGNAAVEAGLADQVADEQSSAQALFDLSMFNNVPPRLTRHVEAGLRDAGYSRREAKAAAAEGFDRLPQRDAGGQRRSRQRDADDPSMIHQVRGLTAALKGVMPA